MNLFNNDTICAISTASGMGAIAIIRLSGSKSFEIITEIFRRRSKSDFVKPIMPVIPNKSYYGEIFDPDKPEEEIIDDVLVTFFKAPHSYTGEDSAEISCHGSLYIQQQILELLIRRGARLAEAGEYTMRAFANKKFDLAQAEAVADLIASRSKDAHDLAMKQMRGGFSNKINALRQQLIDFTALIELELDFSEEDVEFADRHKFHELLTDLKKEIKELINSFKAGNVIKNGIPVAIVGRPNVGKSTLLNALLNEERAIVSDIPGTTRDSVEDTYIIHGHTFRFIDTAGLREAGDTIEDLGIKRTYKKIKEASIVLYVCDVTDFDIKELDPFKKYMNTPDKRFVLIANKVDLLEQLPAIFKELSQLETIYISAKRKENIQLIADVLVRYALQINMEQDTIVSNMRHYQALLKTYEDLNTIEKGINEGIPTDLLTTDIRSALFHLGTITGEINTEDVLDSVFSKFCIGK